MLRGAVGPEGRVVPQQWLSHASALGVAAYDQRRLDFLVYGDCGEALCCDATLVSPLRRDSTPVPGAAEWDGVAGAGECAEANAGVVSGGRCESQDPEPTLRRSLHGGGPPRFCCCLGRW